MVNGIRDDIYDFVVFLNHVNELDPKFLSELIDTRVECNDAVAQHPTIQVASGDGENRCGFLGLVNGYFGAFEQGERKGWGAITATVEPDGTVFNFYVATSEGTN